MNLTVMVTYRALAQTTSVRETFRLGSMESIIRELRLSGDSTSYGEVRRVQRVFR
jgi:hypothetical protein